MPDLTVFAWNVEHMGATKASRIASVVADTIDQAVGATGAGSQPFVGYLLEVGSGSLTIQATLGSLLPEMHRRPGLKGVVAEVFDCEGTGSTRENIIILSRGVKVTNRPLGFRARITAAIEDDKRRALEEHPKWVAAQQDPERTSPGLRPTSRRVEDFRNLSREGVWYRDGVLSDVQFQGRRLLIASIHAPGPQITSDRSNGGRVIGQIMNAVDTAQADLLIGDLNWYSEITHPRYTDIAYKGLSTGTTYRKVDDSSGMRAAPGTLGPHKWDRAVIRSGSIAEPGLGGHSGASAASGAAFEAYLQPLVHPVGDANAGQTSDHALISVVLRPVAAGAAAASPLAPQYPAAPLAPGGASSPLSPGRKRSREGVEVLEGPPSKFPAYGGAFGSGPQDPLRRAAPPFPPPSGAGDPRFPAVEPTAVPSPLAGPSAPEAAAAGFGE